MEFTTLNKKFNGDTIAFRKFSNNDYQLSFTFPNHYFDNASGSLEHLKTNLLVKWYGLAMANEIVEAVSA